MRNTWMAAALAGLWGCDAAEQARPDAAAAEVSVGDADAGSGGTGEDAATVPECPPTGATGTTVGATVQDYSLKDCAGEQQTLYSHCGERLVLIALTYPWCPPCIEVIPELAAIATEYEGEVTVVQILFESATGLPATTTTCKNFVEEHGVQHYQVLIDPLKDMDAYYEKTATESPGRILLVDGRSMELLYRGSEYEEDEGFLRALIDAELARIESGLAGP
jgi:thiol-disulfide isomerase/thioredoxin